VHPRAVANFLSIARIVIGGGLIVAPQLATPMWIGRRGLTPAARLLTRALGARDMAIGIGVLGGLRSDADLRPWLAAGMLADATDLVATIVEREDVPNTALPLVVATAGTGVALGAFALLGADKS
jgi:hypothetical protein